MTKILVVFRRLSDGKTIDTREIGEDTIVEIIIRGEAKTP